ncbi:MAG: hypothetical protein HFI87_03290 [Bacilli bacterium]|nr:hypothetical protein [Bacilli bacterium]
MDINMMGEKEKEVKILDLTTDDLLRIDDVMKSLGAKKVADYTRHIMTFDNGTSKDLNQLLRVTEEDGYTKVTLHINQNDEDKKRHIKFHLPQSDRFIDFIDCRYNEKMLADTYARRISYELGESDSCIDFDIDCFECIPAFMEIDIENLGVCGYTLQTLIEKLNLQDKRCVVLGTESIHELYGVNYFEAYKKEVYKK